MTTTSTYTWTATVPRIELLYAEFEIALLNAGVATRQEVKRYKDPGLRQRWIEGISIFGFGPDGLARAELRLTVSWSSHDQFIAKGMLEVSAHPTWASDAAPELEVLEGLFLDAVELQGLRKELRFHLSAAVRQSPELTARAYRELGLQDANAIAWAGTPEEKTRTLRNLPEAQVGFKGSF